MYPDDHTRVEVALLKVVLSPETLDKVTVAMFQWDGTCLRHEWSLHMLPSFLGHERTFFDRALVDVVKRIHARSPAIVVKKPIDLADFCPIRKGSRMYLEWQLSKPKLVLDPDLYFKRLWRAAMCADTKAVDTLRKQNEYRALNSERVERGEEDAGADGGEPEKRNHPAPVATGYSPYVPGKGRSWCGKSVEMGPASRLKR